MSQGKGWIFQCQSCGALHKLKIEYDIESDLYIKMECPRCRDETNHLWCGLEDDIYQLYNVNLDPRYYLNNTK